MNPISATSWLWKALRGRSVTFAALFAATLLGFSVLRWLRHALAWSGAPWFMLLIAPAIVLSILARKEAERIPDEERRKAWSRGLVFGSILAAVLAGWLTPEPPKPEGAPLPAVARPTGPRSK